MLLPVQSLFSFHLLGLDGDSWNVSDVYFDDRFWTVRYLVAETGGWLSGRKVLISPYALGAIDPKLRRIPVHLNRKQIEESPSPETRLPVSRQFEVEYNEHHGWPDYWDGPYTWGGTPYLEREPRRQVGSIAVDPAPDRNLRSCREVTGYQVEAIDGEIGHVDDFVVDDQDWTFRYLIIGKRIRWPGGNVLVSVRWIDRVSWEKSRILINLSRDAIRNSPPYSASDLLSRKYEEDLHLHYQRQGYWTGGPGAA